MKSITSKIAAVFLVLLVGGVALFLRNSANNAARQDLLSLWSRLKPGMPQAEVQKVVNAIQPSRLELRELDPGTLQVQTPLQWGAQNWVLWVELQNDQVHALRIRYMDDRTQRPANAPQDKVQNTAEPLSRVEYPPRASDSPTTTEERVDSDGDGTIDELREVLTNAQGQKVMETRRQDKDGDGQFDFYTRKILFDGKRVFVELSLGGTNSVTRTYQSGNRVVMAEDDMDRDGIFEVITLYGPNKEITGILARDSAGQVVPASPDVIAKVTQSRALFDQTVKPVMEAIIEKAKENQSE